TDGGARRWTVHAAAHGPAHRGAGLVACTPADVRPTAGDQCGLTASRCGQWPPALISGCGPPGEQWGALESEGRRGRDPRWDIRHAPRAGRLGQLAGQTARDRRTPAIADGSPSAPLAAPSTTPAHA